MDHLTHILKVLVAYGVRFVVIGNGGAALLGAEVLTEDLDLALARGRENRKRLIEALGALDAHHRLIGEVKGR